MPARSICVYCSSSSAVAPAYFEAARLLGEAIARRGHSLVYGGADVGLMGELARSAKTGGARVVGVIPEAIRAKGIAAQGLDELVVTRDMRERKGAMEALADAFIALPGGFGTLEELLEIVTLRQLRYHSKPVVLLNVDGFWNPLAALFDGLFESRFAHDLHRGAYQFAEDISGALDLAESVPADLPDKWI